MRPAASAPVLTDGVVTLREPRDGDLDAIVEQSRDPETPRWTTVPEDYRRQDGESFLGVMRVEQSRGERTSWVIERDGAFAGLVHLRHEDPAVSEVGFVGHPAQRGQGNVTRAVRLACTHAFAQGDAMVVWNAWVGNFGSRKVAWKCGFDITPGVVWRAAPPRQGGGPQQVWTGRLMPGDRMEPRHRWLTAPVLDGYGIRLRPLAERDAARMPRTLDPALAAYASPLPTPEEFGDWLVRGRTREAQGEAVELAIVDDDDLLLGSVGVSRLGVRLLAGTGMVGYWLLPDARGRGVVDRALDVVVPWAFRAEADGGLGLHRVAAGCAVTNRASARVLRRAGFALVGTERQLLQVDGVAEDALLFDLTAEDDRDAQRIEPGHVKVIDTERFRLRPWREDDVPGPDEGPDEDSRRFMPPRAQPDAQAYPEWLRIRQRRHDTGLFLDWCVADRETDHALGNLTVFRLDPPRERFQAEIGYWLRPPARGRGVLAEVVPAMIDHAFRPVADGGLGLSRLYAETDLRNDASQNVLLRSGFRRWGEDRQAYRGNDGELEDGAYFELLATDERVDHRPPSVAEPTLGGARVQLRPWRTEDAPRIVEACTDPRTRHWLGQLPDPYRLEDAEAYIARCHQLARNGNGLFLAVANLDEDVCVGSIALMGLQGRDPAGGEIGYWTHPDARGRGVMTEAVELLVGHALGELGRRRLVLKAAAGNPASQHVAEANGFQRVGLERQSERLGDGTFDDVVVFDRLADDPVRPSP